MKWRTANNRCRPHWRWIGEAYVRFSRRHGIIWHPETRWDDKPWTNRENGNG